MTDQTIPAPTDGLRQRIAEAIYRSHWPRGRWEMRPTEDHDLYLGHADAVLAALEEHLDIGDEEAWCKACRRVWEGRAHRCESDVERRLAISKQMFATLAFQAGKDQAAIKRVRELHSEWPMFKNGPGVCAYCTEDDESGDHLAFPCPTIQALNGQTPAHDAGPTVREAAADDRRWWNGEKAGE